MESAQLARTVAGLEALTKVHDRNWCDKHQHVGYPCTDCLIEGLFHIEVRAIGEIMTAGTINQWRVEG